MKYFKAILYSVGLLFILLASVTLFMFTTTPGLYLAIRLANLATPGKIHIRHLKGQLINEVSFADLTYSDDTVDVHLINTQLNWHLTSLFHQQLTINSLQAKQLIVQIKDTPKAIKKTAETDFDFPELPFKMLINKVMLDKLTFQQGTVPRTLTNVMLQATFDNQQWVVHQLDSNYKNLHVSLQGNVIPKAPYALAAHLKFAPITTQPSGIRGELKLGGDLSLYHWQGKFSGPIQGTIRGVLKAGSELNTELLWQEGRWVINKEQTILSERGRLTISGRLNDLFVNLDAHFKSPLIAQWQADVHIKDNKINGKSTLHTSEGVMNATVSFDDQANPKFKGEITTNNLNLDSFSLPLKNMAVKTTFNGNSAQHFSTQAHFSVDYLGHLLQGDATYNQANLQAKILLGTNHIEISGNPPYQLRISATLPQPNLLHPSLEGLQTTILATANVQNAQQGDLTMSISPGIYQPAKEDKTIPAINFRGGNLTATLTAKALQAKGLLTIDAQKTMDLSLRLPKFRLDNAAALTQIIDGKLNLHINSLDFLQGISPIIENPHGQLNLALTAKGTLKKPVINGVLDLANASVFIPQLNLTLSPITLKLQSQNKEWKAQGSIMSNGQSLAISGNGTFSPAMSGSIKINGDNFQLMKTAECTFSISPQLVLNIKPQSLAINGSIVIPTAQLKPVSFSSTQSLTDDAVFVNDKPATPSLPLNISTDVHVSMGQDVALNVKGLHGFLDGAIQIKQFPQGEPYASGELTIRDGKYTAYGQDLVIEQGQLIFTGGMINNPAIRIRAVRYFNNTTNSFSGSNKLFDFNSANTQTLDFGNKTTVGISVGGRINATKIKLFSIPPTFSQADILSMIILGRPASQASKSGGQLLLTAITSMNLDSGTKGIQLIEQLKQSSGLDFNFENTSSYNQKTNQVSNGNAFVVTKTISKRLFVSYNIGLLQSDSNVLTLKYLLNKFFSIQVSASDSGNGIDLLYSHSKE